ncbi:hypothetical protein [uncultured Bacteroides sp.]|uniref:hypothetical protein n=1 Tax=uncultured Bacteroides sp. TaxID=162156 RepID=UPI0025D748C2|nr:hypothetical protein [uncultured Bacteroides sp.]
MTKQDYTIICPVCGKEIPDSICHNCGYVKIVFPQVVPDTITQFDTERVSVLKNNIEREAKQQSEAVREAARFQAKIDELDRGLARIEESAKRAQAENSSLSSQVSNQKQQIRILEIERDNAISKGSDDVKKYQSEISDLQNLLSRKSIEAANLTTELVNVKTQLHKVSSTPQNPLKGVVIIEDVINNIRFILPIYEGSNSYGSNPDNGLHHQIKFQVRGFSFRPVHFIVKTSAKGLIIEAVPEVEILQNGGSIRSGAYARQSDNFMLENRIRINISQFNS